MEHPDAPIALFLPDFPPGGVEVVTARLAAGLATRGPVHLVLASNCAVEAPFPVGVEVVRLGASRTLSSMPALVRYLRRVRPLGLVTAKDHASVVALLARSVGSPRTRVVVAVHLPIGADGPHRAGFTGRFLPAIVRACFPLADAVVAVSRSIADGLIELGIPRELVHVIANPVTEDDMATAALGAPSHPWLDIPLVEPVLVWAGRLNPEKCVDVLLRAFAAVTTRRRARLVVVGDGPDRGSLEELATGLGIQDGVSFTGQVPDARPYLARASVVVLCSRLEGLPTVLIEALALGRQVVSTDCATGPEEILDGGRLGRLVPVGDVVALANAIGAAIDAPLPPASPGDLRRYSVVSATDSYLNALGMRGLRETAPSPGPTVALAILCHNRPRELGEAVSSASGAGFAEIVVVDNGSDPPLQPIAGTRWTRLNTNAGVAQGRNRLVRETRSNIVFFLDDDGVIASDGAADAMADLFCRDPGLGAVACRVQRRGGATLASEHPFRGPARDVGSERWCAYFVGAAHAVRRAAWENAGGLDPSFFYSTEEIDLSMGLAGRGWRIRYAPHIVVEHRPSGLGRQEPPRIPAMRLRNRIVFARRHLPWPVGVVHVAVWAARTALEGHRAGSIRPWLAVWPDVLRSQEGQRKLSLSSLVVAHRRGGRVFW